MKKIIKLVLCVLILTCIFGINAYAESQISVYIDGVAVNFTDALPFIDENGRTQAPLRAIAEALGCSIDWNDSLKMASIRKDYTESDALETWIYDIDESNVHSLYEYSRVLELTIGSNTNVLNRYNSLFGEQSLFSGGYSEQVMDTSPIIKDNRTYLPVRYLAESFGYNVSWDNVNNSTNIVSQNSLGGRFNSDVVSTFSDICAIALYENDFTKLNRDFINIENVSIEFSDGRKVDVTESFLEATDELKEVYVDNGGDFALIEIEYAGKVNYDFSPAENQVFKLIVKANVADKEGNTGYQTYIFHIDITQGEGGYL